MNAAADLVTIVMPAFNEERFIMQTLLSVVDSGCRILISDSGSTDETPRICRYFVRKHPNITYFPASEKIDAMLSLMRLVYASETSYTMLMRSRDIAGQDLVEIWLRDMLANPDAALSAGPHYRLNWDGFIYLSDNMPHPERLLSDNPGERILALVEGLYYNPFYSMYKTDILRTIMKIWDEKNHEIFIGFDFILMLHIAAYNKMVYSKDAVYVVRDKFKYDGTNQYLESYKNRFCLSKNERKYPHNRLGRELASFLDEHLLLDSVEKKYYTEKIKKVFAKKSEGLNFSFK
jgi:glycosyltransferase involved in cell wall biosynthesis